MKYRPELVHCEQNVIHIINDYNRAVKMGCFSLNGSKLHPESGIYNDKKYEAVKRHKSTIGAVRKNPQAEWTRIKQEAFENLIDVLYDHKYSDGSHALTLWSNKEIYKSTEALYHSRNLYYNDNSGLDISKLVGQYRIFKIATNDNECVLGGKLEIIQDNKLNILKTIETSIFKPKNDNIIYQYHGTIHYAHDASSLIWEDGSREKSFRQTRLLIRPEANVVNMEGVMFLNFGRNHFTRSVYIDNQTDGFEIFADHYTSDKIPDKFKAYLKPSSVIKHEYSANV